MGDHSKVVMMPVRNAAADGKPADPPPAGSVESRGTASGGRGGGGNGGDKDLTPQQLRAVSMLATGWRPTKVIEELDIDASTLYRWRRIPAFAVALEEAVNDLKEDLLTVARGSCNLAVDTLYNLMADGPAGASLSAAVVVLRMNGLLPR